MAPWCWWTPPKVRCRRPNLWSPRALKVGLKPIVVINKVGPPRRAADRSHQRSVRPVSRRSTPAKSSSIFPILYGSAKQGWMAEKPGWIARRRHAAAVRPDPAPCRAARPSKPARFRMIGTILEANPLSRPHHHRPHHVRHHQAQPERQGARRRRQADRDRADHQDHRVPRQSSAPRWMRLKPATSSPLQASPKALSPIPFCDPLDRHPAEGAADRSADGIDVVHRQQLTAGRPPKGDKVTSRMIRDRLMREAEGNCRAARHRSRRQGFHGSFGPRRIAACDPDRGPCAAKALNCRCRVRASC